MLLSTRTQLQTFQRFFPPFQRIDRCTKGFEKSKWNRLGEEVPIMAVEVSLDVTQKLGPVFLLFIKVLRDECVSLQALEQSQIMLFPWHWHVNSRTIVGSNASSRKLRKALYF